MAQIGNAYDFEADVPLLLRSLSNWTVPTPCSLDWRKLTGGVIKSSLFSNKRGGKKRIFIFAKCKKTIRQKNMLCKLLLSVFLSFERYSAVGVVD